MSFLRNMGLAMCAVLLGLVGAAAPALGDGWDVTIAGKTDWDLLGPVGLTIRDDEVDPLSLYLRGELWGYEWRVGFLPVEWGPSPGEDLLFSGGQGLPLVFIAKDYSGFEILPPMHYENFYARLNPRGGSDRYLIGRRYTTESGSWRFGLTETALLSGDFSPYYLIPYPFFPLSVCKVFLDRSIVGDENDANILYALDVSYAWDNNSLYGALMLDEAPVGERTAPWRIGLQLGAGLDGVFGRDDLSLWLEYTAFSRYVFTYLSGYEAGDYWQDGELIGHSLGPDADLFQARLGRNFSSLRGWLGIAVERHGSGRFGDRWVEADGEELEFLTGTVEASYWLNLGLEAPLGDGCRLALEVGGARVENEGNVQGASGHAAKVSLELAYEF